jgi:two-component system, OmpR family, response regulator ResD
VSKLLVVDDEPDIRLVARIVLEHEGFDVDEADDGRVALTACGEGDDIDLVLLDVRMPHLDGWQVLAQLRERGLLDHLRVVMISAHAEQALATRAIDEGATAYIRKPFALDQLVDVVRDALAAPPGATAS